MDARKRIILKIAAVFAGLVLVLIFFSSTISNARLPMVTVGVPTKGVVVNKVYGTGLAELMDTKSDGYGCRAEIALPLNADRFFKDGQPPDFYVSIPSKWLGGLDAKLATLQKEPGVLKVVIEFDAPGLSGGELVKLNMQTSIVSEYVLPNSAIHEDEDGSIYVLTVDKRKSSIGYEYVLVKSLVLVKDSNERYTALRYSLSENPVVINSDRPVYDGARVRLADGGDYVGSR